MLARVFAGSGNTFFAFLIGSSNDLPDFAFALSHASHLLLAKSKSWNLNLWQGNADQPFFLAANQFSFGNIFFEILFNAAFNNIFKAVIVPLHISNHDALRTSPIAKI